MKASNKQLPILLVSCMVAATNSAAMAGPQSVLDPYFMVPAPKNTQEAREARDPKLRKQREREKKLAAKAEKKEKEHLFEEEAASTKDIKFEESKIEDSKLPETKLPETKIEKSKAQVIPVKATPVITETTKPKTTPVEKASPKAQAPARTTSPLLSNRPSFIEGMKQIGGGIVMSTKATGYDIADGTKAVYHGVRWSGAKIASGAVATKDKIASLHSNGFKDSMASAGSSIKNGTVACGSKVVAGTKWVGRGAQVAAIKTVQGGQWAAEKVGAGMDATKTKCVNLFGSGVSDTELAANADPTKTTR